jgi:hypothetical protein
VYAQWFHLYESDEEVVSLVLRTYASVFPYVSVWFTLGPDLLLLGFEDPERALDVAAMQQRFARPDFEAGFARVGIRSLAQLLAHEVVPIGTLHALPLPGDLHTLRHPVLSYRAARAFFRGVPGTLPPLVHPAQTRVAERNSLLRRLAGSKAPLSEEVLEAAARETCHYGRLESCATFAARWRFDYPDSPRAREVLAELREQGEAERGLRPARIVRLIALHGGRVGNTPDGISPQRAAGISERYVDYYHPAVPFDRERLDSAWRLCRGEECEEARRRAEELLGTLARP